MFKSKIVTWVKILSINVALLIALLSIGEILVRIIMPNFKPYERTFPGQYEDKYFNDGKRSFNWVRKDRDLGWVCNDTIRYLKFSNNKYNNLNIEYYINRQGFRYPYDFFLNEFRESNVMMLGDSFMFGVYLNNNETITAILNREFKNRLNFVNMGVPGYGIDQMYLTYTKFNQVVKPRIIILFYIDDDVYRTWEAYKISERLSKPSFKIEDNKITFRSYEKPSLIERIFQKSYFLNVFYKEYSHLQRKNLTGKIFDELIDLIFKNNQKLIIIRCPTDYQLINDEKFSNLSFKHMFTETNVYYYELFEDLKKFRNDEIIKMYLKNDGHLSAYGTKIVSELIYSKIKELGILTE